MESRKSKVGRKPGTDNKLAVTVYVQESVLTNLGKGFLISGKERAREAALQAIYNLNRLRAKTKQLGG